MNPVNDFFIIFVILTEESFPLRGSESSPGLIELGCAIQIVLLVFACLSTSTERCS